MQNPIVSIILPNHNYAQFIPDAIESIKAQTLHDWECIIIDDASNDNSVKVIQNLIANDKRFQLIALDKSVGISAARNIGLDKAIGEYIAFLDSDDCYTKCFLEMLVNLAHKANVDVAGARVKFIDGYFKYNPQNDSNTFNIDKFELHNNHKAMLMASPEYKWIWVWRRIYKRSVLDDARFPENMKINGDDITFMLDITHKITNFAETSNIGVYHRIHPLSITSDYQEFNPERIKMFPILFKHIREKLLMKYNKGFFCKLYSNLFTYMLTECLVKYAGKLSKEDIQFVKNILIKSCKLIPSKFLPWKQRLLCWYISWQR